MPNAAPLAPLPSIRPPLPKADIAVSNPPGPDFAGLLDASSGPPAANDAPRPTRGDPAQTPSASSRADNADNNPPPGPGANTTSGAAPNGGQSGGRDAARSDPAQAAPDAAKATGSGKTRTDKKQDTKAPEDSGEGVDVTVTSAAAQQQGEAMATTGPAASIAPAPAPAAAGAVTAETTASAGMASAITGVAAGAAGTIVTTPVLAVVGAATAPKAQPGPATEAVSAIGAAETKLGEAVAPAQPAKTPAKTAVADNQKNTESALTENAAVPAQGDGAASAAVDQANQLAKSLPAAGAGKPQEEEHPAVTRTDSKPALDSALAANAPANNTTTMPMTGFGAAAFSAGAPPAAIAGAQASTASDAAVPMAGLAVEIASRARDGSKSFEIRLDPPDLGRIHVRLDIDNRGNVTSHLMVDRADTYDLLRRDFSGLERALNDAGLKTGDNSLQFTMRDQGFTGGQQQSSGGFTNVSRVVVPSEMDSAAGASRYNLPRLGGVDIRV